MREPCPGAISFEPVLHYSPTRGHLMRRQGPNGLQRAYRLWTAAGLSLMVSAAAGSSVIRLLSGMTDAGSTAWGIVGIAALLDALVLFVLGWQLRQRYVNTVQTYESRGACLADGGSNRPSVPLLGDGQARPNITNPGPGV